MTGRMESRRRFDLQSRFARPHGPLCRDLLCHRLAEQIHASARYALPRSALPLPLWGRLVPAFMRSAFAGMAGEALLGASRVGLYDSGWIGWLVQSPDSPRAQPPLDRVGRDAVAENQDEHGAWPMFQAQARPIGGAAAVGI